MNRLKLTSAGLLLILAIVASAGIFLTDVFYLRPHAQAQEQAAICDQASHAEQAARLVLNGEERSLLDYTAAWSSLPEMSQLPQSASDSEVPQTILNRLLAGAEVDRAWITTPEGKTIAQATRTKDSSAACDAAMGSFFRTPWALKNAFRTGLVKLPDGLAMFARQSLWSDPQHTTPAGGLWVVRYIDREVLSRINAAIGGDLVFVGDIYLPPNELSQDEANHSIWQTAQGNLTVAWRLHDLLGKNIGYFRATLPPSPTGLQGAGVRRTVLIIMTLSLGLSLLVILGAHILVTGPVVRLLGRLQRLESGQGTAKDLVRNLHGEPLVLARRLESAFDRLAQMSKTDQLTGLANRRHFEQVLGCFYNQARRYNRPMSLIVLDLDFFKAINDTGGHQAGDEVLKKVAGAIEQACRKADLPARLGGDEFAVLLPETACHDAMIVGQRISEAVAALKIDIKNLSVKLTTSAGLADLNSGEINGPEGMLALADRALYAAKDMGRNRVVPAHDLTGLNWRKGNEAGSKVDVMCKKLAGLDNQFKDLFLRAIEEMVTILENRSPHMADHARKVQHYSTLIAQEMGLPERVIKHISIAAMLHDIGMIVLPDAILMNPGPLDEQQEAMVRRHPLLSVRIMEGMEFLEQEIPAVRYHHERYDGQGYPEGIPGPAIPLTARILSVADSFDAMTSTRTFRPARSRLEAMAEIHASSGGQFDPSVAEAFLTLAARMGDKIMELPGKQKALPDADLPAGRQIAQSPMGPPPVETAKS